jgi:hypothetical protein
MTLASPLVSGVADVGGGIIVIRRRVAFLVAMVGVGILAGALAVWTIALPHATGPALTWSLATNTYGPPAAPPPDTTVVKVRVEPWPACHPYDEPSGFISDGSWLVADVSYSSQSVTITLHRSSSFDASKCLGWYDTWFPPVEINLREPLNGRTLIDGASGYKQQP